MQETWVRSLGLEDALEEGMATHSSILAWRIPWTEEPGRLQSMGSQRAGHNRATKHSTKSMTGKMFTGISAEMAWKKIRACDVKSGNPESLHLEGSLCRGKGSSK